GVVEEAAKIDLNILDLQLVGNIELVGRAAAIEIEVVGDLGEEGGADLRQRGVAQDAQGAGQVKGGGGGHVHPGDDHARGGDVHGLAVRGLRVAVEAAAVHAEGKLPGVAVVDSQAAVDLEAQARHADIEADVGAYQGVELDQGHLELDVAGVIGGNVDVVEGV